VVTEWKVQDEVMAPTLFLCDLAGSESAAHVDDRRQIAEGGMIKKGA
jgi:hypothetical protein